MPLSRPWTNSYDPWVVCEPVYPAQPLTHVLDDAAAAMPDRVAVEFAGASLTFAALQGEADALAAALQQLGIGTGDTVGVMLPNCPQYLVSVFAVLRLGAVVVNINPAYTARELQVLTRDADLRALIALDTCLPGIRTARTESPIAIVIATALTDYAGAAAAAPLDDERDVRRLLPVIQRGRGAAGRTLPLPMPAVKSDDLAVLQYTGGTTGRPRAAMLSHANIFANLVQSVAFMYGRVDEARQRRDRYLMVIPFFHIYGFTVGMMRGIWIGATQRLMPQFRPDTLLDAIREFAPGYVPGVPTIYVALLNHPAVTTSGLERVRVFNTGGAPCPVALIERFERTTGRPLNEGYGLSESSPAISSTPQRAPRRPGTVGIPLPDTDIKIIDLDTGATLPPGNPGELCVAGPQVMRGYWKDAESTARTLRRDDDGRVWLHTGDIATVDEQGFITIVQRKKDVIVVDALKVFPSEVESVLLAHPAVTMAAVIGMPDDYHGETVHAHVVLRPSATVEAGDLIDHCRAYLAPYKVPVSVAVRESLPVSAVGKTLYRVLREEPAPLASSRPEVPCR